MENSMCLAMGVGGIHSDGYLDGSEDCMWCGAKQDIHPGMKTIGDRDPSEIMGRACKHMLERVCLFNDLIQSKVDIKALDHHTVACQAHGLLLDCWTSILRTNR